MNQKGFIIAPVILWIVGALVLTGTVAVREGLISIDLSEKITHDGSRTGSRVGYQSFCYPEQGVVIYENEKMPFVTDEGEHVLWTQGDIDCYKEKKLQVAPIPTPKPTSTPTFKPVKPVYVDPDPIINCESSYPNCKGSSIKAHKSQCSKITCCQIGNKWSVYPSGDQCKKDQDTANKLMQPISDVKSAPSEPTVTCVLPYGTFHVPQVHCDTAKAALSNLESTKKDFDKDIERIRQESDQKANEISKPIPQPIPELPTYRDYNDPVCQQVRQEWEQIKGSIGPLDASNQNYSSSADGMRDYLSWRDKINGIYSDNRCQGYLN